MVEDARNVGKGGCKEEVLYEERIRKKKGGEKV